MKFKLTCSTISLTYLVLGQVLVFGLANTQPKSVSTPKLSAIATFRCLWWAEEQMDGLNPNSPPPKTTEVVLKKWEYSDPIAVPHPDVVDLVVELSNDTDMAANNLTVNVSTRWLIGPQRSRARSVWRKAVSIERLSAFKLEPRGKHTHRIPVNLAEQMKKLEKTRSWPWCLQASILITSATGKVLLKTRADLPITPGD